MVISSVILGQAALMLCDNTVYIWLCLDGCSKLHSKYLFQTTKLARLV